MKVYVTGYRGFVGKNLVQKLKNLNYEVLFDNIDLKKDKNLFYKSIAEKKPDWLINCAAVVGGIGLNIQKPFKFLFDNLQIQNNVIDVCLECNISKVLFLGSSCIYPKDYRQPLTEEDLLAAPLEPTNEGYAIAKIAGLKLCEYANKEQNNTKFVSLMPCNLYGPGDHFDLERSHVLSSLVRKIVEAKYKNIDFVEIWGNGEPKREWLYIDDLVDGIIWAMNNIEKTEKFLNIGTGQDISIKDLAYKIANIVDYKGFFRFDLFKPNGMMKKCLDVSKINKLGWKAKVSLDDGLVKTIEYFKKEFNYD